MAVFSVISKYELNGQERWDAEYYQPQLRELNNTLEKRKAVKLDTYVAFAQRGQQPDYDSTGKIPVIRTVNVRDLEISNERPEYVTETFFADNKKGQVISGNIVVTSTGMGTLGRVFCNLYDRRYFADGHITVLRLKDDSKASWITAVLQSPIGARQLEQRQRGSSGQIEIYPEDILNVLIPMLSPRMAEIVGRKWSEAVELVEKSKTLYPEAEMELLERMGWEACKNERELYYTREFNELVQSERIDAEYHQPKYERLLQLLNKRGSMSLADLLKSCDKGMQPEGYDDDGEVIVVKSKNVFGQGIELTTCERTTSRAWESKYSRLGNGDAVINSTGMGTLGRAGVVHCDGNQKIVASVDLLILRVNHKLVDPDYLALFLNSPAGISQSEQYQTGSSGQLHIYPEHVNKFVVFIARHKNGEIDLSWQTNLGEKIRKAAQAKADARIKLEEAIKTVMERSLG